MNKKILNLCKDLERRSSLIPDERKVLLNQLVQYISNKQKDKLITRLNVICTHNSRRSHIGQLWILIASKYYGVEKIESFSGGTEATALNPRVVTALKNVGFEITSDNIKIQNPIYKIKWDDEIPGYKTFSKVFSDYPNPNSDFGAIMVCTEADKGCPFVSGADFRLALPYKDPKAYDDTEKESEAYIEKIKEIGTEIMYTFKQVSNL